jgi:heme/copper-type cytochrome/quinol oxidase subunit 2
VGFGVNTRAIYDGLAAVYAPIAAVVFVLVLGALVWVLARRGSSEGTDDPKLELGYAVLLALVAAGLIVATFRAVDREDARAAARPADVVRVVAGKWEWRFRHADGRVERDVLTVPAGREIEFRATSVDVLHGFWIPALKFQRELVPGRTTTFRLTFERPGWVTSGACSFFCGLEHARMRFAVNVVAA